MSTENPSKFACELGGETNHTSEHENQKKELPQEWPDTDYIEDVPEAVIKGQNLFARAKKLEQEGNFEEAISVLSEDKFAVAAHLAASAQKNSRGLIWVPIKINATYAKYQSDPNIVPRRKSGQVTGIGPRGIHLTRKGYNISFFQGWRGPLTPFAPWVQKMYANDRPNPPGKEMANFTGDERLRDYLEYLKQQQNQKRQG